LTAGALMQHWPFPPFFRDAAGDDTLAGSEAIAFTTADETRHGALERFDLQAQLTVLMPHEGAAAITLPFSAIKSIQLMPPIVLASDEELTRRYQAAGGHVVNTTSRPFTVQFTDGELCGDARVTPRMKRTPLVLSLALVAAVSVGCATLDAKQREWIFQPSDRSWGGAQSTEGMQDVWIELPTQADGRPEQLHGLWLPQPQADAPVLLYLHGARWNVAGSSGRIRRMHELGFSVLAIDYRGFGKSSAGLPSEASSAEDARAAWQWLAAQYPDRPRYIFGHSLGGAIAIELARQVQDEQGTMVEGTFTSIPDVVSTFRWGWLPVSPLITQRFESVRKVGEIGSPLLVVHGSEDRLIQPALGRKLYEAAQEPKQFVLVEGGSHHNTNAIGQGQYRQAMASLFRLPTR